MITVKIEGLTQLKGAIEAITKNQMPFAIAKALTATAQDICKEVIGNLPQQFTLRTSWYQRGPYAFKVDAAKKNNLVASVYTRAPWMQMQETGGRKTPRGKALAIPTDNVRRTKRDLIAKSQRPRALHNAVILPFKNGKGLGLFIRTGRGKKKQLKFMYNLEASANVPKRLHFLDTAKRVADRRWLINAQEAINHALRTAR